MYKSAVGLFITNGFMIWLVLLNNEGPGWEVPSFVFLPIALARLLMTVGLALSIGTLLWSAVDAPEGQYWHEDFPMVLFGLLAAGVDVMLLAAVSVARFGSPAPRSSLDDAGS
jgi:hypothetical protein